MKIAYLNTSFNIAGSTGGNTHVGEFIDEVVQSGHEIFAGQSNHHPKVKHIPIQFWRRVKILMACDVFYIRYEGDVTGTMQLSKFPQRILSKNALIVWEFNTTPEYILTHSGTITEVKNQLALLRREAKICNLAVCVTEEMADYFQKMVGFTNVLVVSNAANPDRFKPCLPIPLRMEFFKDKINVVWAGSLFLPWNNADLLIEVANYLWKIGRDDICIHLIGEPSPDWVQRIPPNVFIYGRLPYEVLPNWFSAMDIGLILYKERQNDFGSPIKLFDYLSNGLAVISTCHPQTSRILGEIGQEEFVMKTEHPDELGKLILKLADNPQQLQIFKEKTRELIVRKYNWANSTQKILAELETMIKIRGKAR